MSNGIVKPGFKSTEFAFLIAFSLMNILAVMSDMLDPKWAGLFTTVFGTAYAILRTMAKMHGVSDDKLPPPSK